MADHHPVDIIQYEEIGCIDTKAIFRITIPGELSQTEQQSLEALFARRIINAAPSINLLDPLPEGFFDDGTVGVSHNAECLTFYVDRATEELEVSFPNGVRGTNNVKFSENYLLVSFAVANSCDIYWKNRLLMSVEKAAFDRALPQLIEFIADGSRYSFDEFSLNLPKFENMVIEISCDSALVKQFTLCYFGAKYIIDASKRFVIKKGLSLDCGAYGYLAYFPDPEEKELILDNGYQPDTRSKTQWESLVEFKSVFFEHIPFHRLIKESNLKAFTTSLPKARVRRL
jgi:hypothetical protein